MGNHRFPLPAYLIAAAFASAAHAADGALPDVVIQAEDKRPVSREKPALDLPVKLDQPLEDDVKTDDGVRARVPSDLNKTTAFAPGVSQSPLSALPSSNWITAPAREPVRTLFPRRELQAVEAKFDSKGRWELVLADSQGKAFRRYAGDGVPPEQLEFDGKDDAGEWLTVGQSYTPVLTYDANSSGVKRTAMGRPFALAGLSVEAPRAIWLAPRALFTSAGSPELTPEGKAILREAAQLVQRHHPGLALELNVRLIRDAGWVKTAGELCAKEVARHLLIKPEQISLKPAPGTADLKERIEIVAAAR